MRKPLSAIFLVLFLSLPVFSQTAVEKYREAMIDGAQLLQRGQIERAAMSFSEAVRLQPDAVEARYYRGMARFALKNMLGALEDFDRAVEKMPAGPGLERIYQMRGVTHYVMGNHEKALADFDKAIAINPDFANSYQGRGNVFADRGENEKALSDYNRSIQLNPALTSAYVDRSILYFDAGKLEDALRDSEKAVELTPNVPSHSIQRGILKWLLGNAEEAFDDIYQGFYLEKESVNERPDESRTSPFLRLSTYVAGHPKNFRALQMRAILRLLQRNAAEAEKDFAATERIDPMLGFENQQLRRAVEAILRQPLPPQERSKIYFSPRRPNR